MILRRLIAPTRPHRARTFSCRASGSCKSARCGLSAISTTTSNGQHEAAQHQKASLDPYEKRLSSTHPVIASITVACPWSLLASRARPSGPGVRDTLARCDFPARAQRSPSTSLICDHVAVHVPRARGVTGAECGEEASSFRCRHALLSSSARSTTPGWVAWPLELTILPHPWSSYVGWCALRWLHEVYAARRLFSSATAAAGQPTPVAAPRALAGGLVTLRACDGARTGSCDR